MDATSWWPGRIAAAVGACQRGDEGQGMAAINAALLAACEMALHHVAMDRLALASAPDSADRTRRLARLGERAELLADAIAQARGATS